MIHIGKLVLFYRTGPKLFSECYGYTKPFLVVGRYRFFFRVNP